MTRNDIELLCQRVGLAVQFHCTDGEIIVGRLHFVSESETDVILDVLSSNLPSRRPSVGDRLFG